MTAYIMHHYRMCQKVCTYILCNEHGENWEPSGSEVECLARDRGATGSSLTGVTALCP